MPNSIKYAALGSPITLIAGDGSSPTLKALASGASVVSAEYDNGHADNRNRFAQIELACRAAVAPSGSPFFYLWFIRSIDGTTFTDGDPSVMPARVADHIINVRTVATQQRVAVPGLVELPAGKFKVLLQNNTGQALTNTDGENVLRMVVVNDEIQ